MKPKLGLAVGVFLTAFLFLGMTFSALAAPAAQGTQYSTPTPGPDGRIIYIVQPGDNCLIIANKTGVTLDYLRRTNNLNENCTIIEGQALVIGVGGPAAASPTPAPSATPTSTPAAPPGASGSARVCVALFNDVNGDGMRQAETDAFDAYVAEGTEPIVFGGAVSLTSLTGSYAETLDTRAGLDPVCFENVPGGRYTVSAAVPEGFNPTTQLSTEIEVGPGDEFYINFGAQIKAAVAPADGGKKASPLLGVFGALLLLAGIGLGVYAWRLRKAS